MNYLAFRSARVFSIRPWGPVRPRQSPHCRPPPRRHRQPQGGRGGDQLLPPRGCEGRRAGSGWRGRRGGSDADGPGLDDLRGGWGREAQLLAGRPRNFLGWRNEKKLIRILILKGNPWPVVKPGVNFMITNFCDFFTNFRQINVLFTFFA
jgi:hypothetical protein